MKSRCRVAFELDAMAGNSMLSVVCASGGTRPAELEGDTMARGLEREKKLASHPLTVFGALCNGGRVLAARPEGTEVNIFFKDPLGLTERVFCSYSSVFFDFLKVLNS